MSSEETLEANKQQQAPKDHKAPEDGQAVGDYLSFAEIFKRLLDTAADELARSNVYLFFSALGAGGALGLTFLSRVILTSAAGEGEPGLVGDLLYPIGFLLIVVGRYQLYTEATLTPVTLVLTQPSRLLDMLRLWIVVFLGNMVGVISFAAAVAYSTVLNPTRAAKALEIGRTAASTPWMDLFYRGVAAGTIVAAMVWLVHSVRDSMARVAVIYILMYLVGVGSFFHVITSSLEVFYASFAGPGVAFWPLWPRFVAPVFLGNTLGGGVIVALLHYAQFAEKSRNERAQSR